MITGYTRPPYLLPFDHRASYISGLFGWKEPLNVEQMVTVADSKRVVYEGIHQTKVLVSYHPEGDVALNQRQAQTLFMFELLVLSTPV